MPIFSKESLENLKGKVDLVDVLMSHMELKKSGASYKALCPFHDEKSPSFMVQKGDYHYHCFGCGAHGDAITFLMNHLKMTFSSAIEYLAEKYHVHLEIVEGTKEAKGPSKALLKEALELANQFYHFILLHTQEGQVALEYLNSRDIDLAFIRQFQIGLAPKAGGLLRAYLQEKGVQEMILEEAGLLTEGKEGALREFFLDRITFPIRDPNGNVIGFSARKYKEETYGGKYVNTRETPLFKKSKVLFGLNYSRRAIAKERKAIIVEGQIDALRLIQEGFNITVAGQGTAFGEAHAKEIITLGINTVFLALDSDTAGQAAALKIGNIFQKEGIEVKIVEMPEKMDPDAFLRAHGAEKFQDLLTASVDYLSFLVKQESKRINIDTPAGKNELVHTVASQIKDWNHELLRHESLRKLAHLAQVPEEVVLREQSLPPNLYIKKSGTVGLPAIDPDRILEIDFLRLLFLLGKKEEGIVEKAKANISFEEIKVPICRLFYEAYLHNHAKGLSCDILTLSTHIDDPEVQLLLEELLQKKINKEKSLEQYPEVMEKILLRNWMQKREEVKMKIQSGQSSEEEISALVQEFDHLKKNPPKLK